MTYPGDTLYPGAGTYPGSSSLLPPEYDPADGALPIVQVLADLAADGPPAAPGDLTASGLHTGDGRGVAKLSMSRGRSTEIGAVQAGTCTVEVDDPQETLNPANTSSPINSGGRRLALYRPLGVEAWWPRRGNTINAANYPGIDPASETPTSRNQWTTTAGTIYNVGAEIAPPWQGERSILAILTGASGEVTRTEPLHTLVGEAHTYSAYVRCSALTPGTTVQIAAGGQLSAVTASTSYVRLSVTFTATAPRTDVRFLVAADPDVVGTGQLRLSIDAEQLEFSDAASEWTATGPVRYPLWAGYIERYPQQWDNRGFHGRRPLEAVDALAVLSRTTITQSYRAEIERDSPQLYVPFDDESGPPKPAGVIGQITRFSSFPRSRGGSIQWQGDTLPDGDKAVSLSYQFQNPAELSDADLAAGQFCELDTRPPTGPAPSLFTVDTRGATFECWLKVEQGSGYLAMFQQVGDGDFQFADGPNTGFGIIVTATGRYFFRHTIGGQSYFGPALGWPDGQWHHVAWSLLPDPSDATKYAIACTFDGIEKTLLRPGLTHRQISINSIHHDVRGYWGDPVSKASVARLAFYARDIGAERRRAHYLRGAGRSGELAAARARRLLDAYWGAARFTVHDGSGLTLPPDHDLDGATVLSALEGIAAADDGLVYADPDGLLVVESRTTRHTDSLYPTIVFGEDAAAGELPYEDLRYDYDPGQVYSEVSLTRPGRSDPLVLVNEATRAMVGRRVLSRSLDVATDWELEQAAIAYLHRYSDALLRVEAMTLKPDSKPEMWPALLALDISRRVRVNRRTSQGTVISGDFYVESIKHEVDQAKSAWSVTLELSPAFVDSGWILGDSTRGVLDDTAAPVY